MIYFLVGSDHTRRGNAVEKLLATLSKKFPESVVARKNDLEITPAELEAQIESQNLWGERSIIVLSGVLGDPAFGEFAIDRMKDLHESLNHFVFIETSLSLSLKKAVEKEAVHFETFDVVKSKGARFNIFGLTDEFGKRDKKKTWLFYREALKNGADPREIHGTLFWIVKAMNIAKRTGNAQASGLNPFVFQKASIFSKNFTEGELLSYSKNLVTLFHESMRKGSDLEVDLEMFLLKAL